MMQTRSRPPSGNAPDQPTLSRPRSGSLFRKLSLSLAGLLLGVIGSYLLLIYWMFTAVADQSEQRLMLDSAVYLAELLEPALAEQPDLRQLQNIGRLLAAANPRLSLFFLDGEGKIIGSLPQQEAGSFNTSIPLEPIKELLGRKGEVALPHYAANPSKPGKSVIFSAAPMTIMGEPGYLYVVLNSETALNYYLMSVQDITVGTTFLGFVAALLLAAFLGARLIAYLRRRLQTVLDGVEKFGVNDFSDRIPIEADDEIGLLAMRANAMADSLEQNIADLHNRDELRRALIVDVSHDLRGPVTSLKGYLGLLEMLKPQALVSKVPEVLPSLRSGTESLERLLGELFELAKLEAQERQPALELVELDALCDETANRCRGIALTKNIEVECNLPDQSVHVMVDPGMLGRALGNLLENAIFYSPEGGKVSLSLAAEDGAARVSIVDTGAGIRPEEIQKIFGRFARGSSSTTSSRTSSGLGLAIVDRILKLHQTTIDVTSEPGRGSSFAFRLPLASSL